MGNQRTRIRRRTKKKTGGTMILPIRDVDNWMVRYLNFWDRRILSQVNTYYWHRFAEELMVRSVRVRSQPQDEHDRQFLTFITRNDIEACRWSYLRRPQNTRTFPYWFVIENNHLEVLRWFTTLHRLPSIILRNPNEWKNSRMKLLAAAVRSNHLEMADFILTWLNQETVIFSEDLLTLADNSTQTTLATIRWIDRVATDRGVTINWSPIITKRLYRAIKAKDWPMLNFSLEVGADWSSEEKQLWLSENLSLFEWGKQHLPVDADQLYHRAIEYKKIRLIKWLLHQKYPSPLPPSLSPIDQTALFLLYGHHQDHLIQNSDDSDSDYSSD